jgi:hypothetical protein
VQSGRAVTLTSALTNPAARSTAPPRTGETMMRTMTAVSLVVASMLLSSPARADEDSGFSIGLRAAYGLPLGSAGHDTDLDKLTSGAVPFQLDVG